MNPHKVDRKGKKFQQFKREALRMGVPLSAFWGDYGEDAAALHCSCFGPENGTKGVIEGFYELWKWNHK